MHANQSDDRSVKSTFYEQLVEHVFISEILQECFFAYGVTVDVLRAEIDASGYDIVFECNGYTRHIQLKTSRKSSKTAKQNVNVALSEKPSGCVVWIVRDENAETNRIDLTYLFFGDEAGKPLPSLSGFKVGRHSKGNKDGFKAERQSIRIVNKGKFKSIPTVAELIEALFDLDGSANV